MIYKKILYSLCFISWLTSCSSGKLITSSVTYQSVRPVNYKSEVPDDAEIIVGYSFTNKGEIVVVVHNNTDEVMIIDQTKSFLVNSDGKSISYYDPTVRVTSNTSSNSTTSGGSVNLGAIAGALGIGGKLGQIASGVNVGGANTDGFSTTNTTYFADQPQVSLGPRGMATMSKRYTVGNLGENFLCGLTELNNTYSASNSYCKFSVCVSYSVDNGNTFDKIVTDFYSNSLIVCPVRTHGQVNDALRNLLSSKTDALYEPWWILHFNSGDLSRNTTTGAITDYK